MKETDKSADIKRYEDIISLPHHQSPNRPHMSIHDRAAQFAPFAALSGYDDMVKEEARLTESENEMSEAATEELNACLARLSSNAEHPEITVIYFKPDRFKSGGSYETFKARVKEIDLNEQALIFYGSENIEDKRVEPVRIDLKYLRKIIFEQ